MSMLQQVCDKMQEILRSIPDKAAVETAMLQRRRKLTGNTLTQILVLGWLERPDASYHHLAETASVLGINVSRQAIEQRITPEAVEMLKTTLKAAIAQTIEIVPEPQDLPLLQHFNGVYIQDSTWIPLPDELHQTWQGARKNNASKKAGLKLHLRLNVLTGRLEDFQLTDGITADSTAEKQFHILPSGSLRLADLAYFSLDELQRLTDAKIHWITRLKVDCHLFDEDGDPLCLRKLLNAHRNDVLIRKHIRVGKTKQLQAYLIAERRSEEETNKHRRYIRYRAKRKNENPSKIRLQLAGWYLYITNLEEHQLTCQQIRSIARIRWQVELMFKALKSIGKIHRSRSKKLDRILAEVYAKLIATLIRHAVMLAAGWRCVRHSFIKATQLIISYARTLLLSFRNSTEAVLETLKDIRRMFESKNSLQQSYGPNTTLRRLQNAAENH